MSDIIAADSLNLKSSLVRNTLPGTEGTYHRSVASIAQCDADTFAARVGKRAGYGAPIVKNVLGSFGTEAADTLSTRLYRINAFGFSIGAEISGSIPAIDSHATDENRPYVSIRPSDEVQDAIAQVKPICTNDAIGAVTIDKVEDEATGKAGVIVGTDTFILTGWGLSTSGEGECITAKSMVDGTETTATVVRNDGGLAVWAKLDSALPEGKAMVVVTTRWGEDDLWPISKTVTVLAGEAPEPEPEPATVTLRTAVTEGMMDNNIRLGSEPITLEGENLTLGEGDKLYARNADYSDDDYVEIPSRFVSRNTATAIDLSEDSGDSLWAWLGEEVEFSEEHGRITFKLVSHGGIPSSEPQTVTTTAVVQFA